LGLFGVSIPATLILTVTLIAATHPRLQGILITATGLVFFVAAMSLMSRIKPAPTAAAMPAAA
jgi:hypothetical protein